MLIKGGHCCPLNITYLDHVTLMKGSPLETLAMPVATSLDFAAFKSISRQSIASLYVILSLLVSSTKPQTVLCDLIPDEIISATISALMRLDSASAVFTASAAVASLPVKCSIMGLGCGGGVSDAFGTAWDNHNTPEPINRP